MYRTRWPGADGYGAALAVYTQAQAAVAQNAQALELGVQETLYLFGLPGGCVAVTSDTEDADVGMAWYGPAWISDERPELIPGRCHIARVYVTPSRWRQGVGRALLRAIFLHARENGYREVQVHTDADNLAARSLYVDEGFALVTQAQRPDGSQYVGLLRTIV